MNFQTNLVNWYNQNKRSLPFRETNDPYKIWISEIMLQQTTVVTVIPYYLHFIEKFPTVHDLAQASLQKVYKCWEGLGYYRRASHLHQSAQVIDKMSHFPNTYEELIKLKGIGPYTASAICSFAYHQPYSAIDGNALRVLSRIYNIQENIALNKTIKKITTLSNELIQDVNSSQYNQGLMDFANAICKPTRPLCQECPMTKFCLAYQNNTQKILPINIKNVKKQEIQFITGMITYQDKLFLIQNNEGLLQDLYGLVQFQVESPFSFIEEFQKKYHLSLHCESHLKDFKHVFTHRTWKMSVYHFVLSNSTDSLYNQKELNKLPISTAHKKIIKYYDEFLRK